MATRTITFADENGRPSRTIKLAASGAADMAHQTGLALQTRHHLDKYVFTSTKGGLKQDAEEHVQHFEPAAPEDGPIERVADSPATKARKERAAAARWGMSGKQVATVAEYFGGAPLNSVAARLQRDAK